MRIRVLDLLEPLPISLDHFLKIARDCHLTNHRYLSEADLRKLHQDMPVKTYKTEALLLRVEQILREHDIELSKAVHE